ncbi:transcriptional regulator [Pseudoxanthomonas sp. YR558]|nr:transcriptional regulator [Pseudoxanthomonas sp. YR558]
MTAMQDVATPLANQLLIASPALSDPNFARSVALICQHDDEGAMGVVVNRPSEYTLGEVLRQMNLQAQDPQLAGQVVLAGGPVHPERGFVLHDGLRAWESTMEVADGLYLTTSRDILEAMAAGDGPAHAIVALGCAGWGAGQLEYELGENSWLTAPADAELLFALPLERRWQAAGQRIGVDMTRLTDYSGHA